MDTDKKIRQGFALRKDILGLRLRLFFRSFLFSCGFLYWFCISIPSAYAWRIETILGITIDTSTNPKPLTALIEQLLNILNSLAGASALVMVFLGAYKYISAGGEPKKAQEGKEIIQSAVYGLVLVLIAFLLAQTLGEFFGDRNAFTETNY